MRVCVMHKRRSTEPHFYCKCQYTHACANANVGSRVLLQVCHIRELWLCWYWTEAFIKYSSELRTHGSIDDLRGQWQIETMRFSFVFLCEDGSLGCAVDSHIKFISKHLLGFAHYLECRVWRQSIPAARAAKLSSCLSSSPSIGCCRVQPIPSNLCVSKLQLFLKLRYAINRTEWT